MHCIKLLTTEKVNRFNIKTSPFSLTKHLGSYSRYENMKLMQTLKKRLEVRSTKRNLRVKTEETPRMRKQKRSLQRLVAERLQLVSVFLSELLGPLGGLRHVGLARHGSLNHLLRKNNKVSNQQRSQPLRHTRTEEEKRRNPLGLDS